MVDIAANITEFRKRCGYTQKELADKIGVSVQTVSKWENSVSAPDISMLSPLASAFSITVDTLIGCDAGTDCVTPSRMKRLSDLLSQGCECFSERVFVRKMRKKKENAWT